MSVLIYYTLDDFSRMEIARQNEIKKLLNLSLNQQKLFPWKKIEETKRKLFNKVIEMYGTILKIKCKEIPEQKKEKMELLQK